MKLLLKTSLSVAVVAAGLLIGSFWLPTRCEVERRIVVDATPDQVYFYLNNPAEWQHWSTLSKNTDPTMIHLYGGPMSGAGARMQWSGDKVGNGQLVLTESISPTTLAYLQSGPGDTTRTKGFFRLAPVSGGTQVVWRQTTELGENPVVRLLGVVQKYKQQAELEKGLCGLKTLLLHHSKKKTPTKRTAYATDRQPTSAG